MKRILIIEDDEALQRILTMSLRNHGYAIAVASDGFRGLHMAMMDQPDLIILDIMMPGMDGYEVCRKLRKESDVPIIMLTAKSMPQDVIQGLRLGADDYIKKPFNLQELRLRIEAVLRRSGGEEQDAGIHYDDGVLRIDEEARLVTIRGEALHLTPTEFRLLLCLVGHAGRVVPHETLLTQAWGPEYTDDTTMLPVYIRYLRQKIETHPDAPRYIVNEWGVGYKFVARNA